MTTAAPKVSVVLCVYNDERHVASSVRSILRGTFTDFEFIVIDDGSTDRTSEVLSRIRDARLRIARRPNRGLAAGRTDGTLAARGEYVAYMDSDDLAEPKRLELQSRFLDQNPDVALVGCAVTVVDERGRPLFFQSAPTGPENIRRRIASGRFCFYGSAVMVRRDAAVDVGLFREEFRQREDSDFFLRMNERYLMDNVPRFLYRYRMNPRSLGFADWGEQQYYAHLAYELAAERREKGSDRLQRGETVAPYVPGEVPRDGSTARRTLDGVLAYLSLDEAQLALEKRRTARAVVNALRAAAHRPLDRAILRQSLRLLGHSLFGET